MVITTSSAPNVQNLAEHVRPYAASSAGKKQQVEEMFDNISPKYDLLNHSLTLGIDFLWRKKAVKSLRAINPKIVLDIATGTGDFAVEAARKLQPQRVIGIDISEGMLEVGRRKMQKKGIADTVEMVKGDSEDLHYPDGFADAVTVGFGVRNFEHLQKGLSEIHRVLRPGGVCVILEPSFPRHFPLKQLFQFYFTKILPLIGRLVSRDKAAYTYLPSSVKAFPSGEEFLEICRSVGFKETKWQQLTLGACAMYRLEK